MTDPVPVRSGAIASALGGDHSIKFGGAWREYKNNSYGHSGGFAGVHAKLEIYPESGYVAVVLSNYDRGAARIIERIQDTLSRVE